MAQMLADSEDNMSSASNSTSDLSHVDSLVSCSSDVESLADKNSCHCRNQSNPISTKDQSHDQLNVCCQDGQSGCGKNDQMNKIMENNIQDISKMNLDSKKPDPRLLDF